MHDWNLGAFGFGNSAWPEDRGPIPPCSCTGGWGGFDGSVLKACLDLRIRDEQILLRIILLFKA
jgi:hypothetical protein